MHLLQAWLWASSLQATLQVHLPEHTSTHSYTHTVSYCLYIYIYSIYILYTYSACTCTIEYIYIYTYIYIYICIFRRCHLGLPSSMSFMTSVLPSGHRRASGFGDATSCSTWHLGASQGPRSQLRCYAFF